METGRHIGFRIPRKENVILKGQKRMPRKNAEKAMRVYFFVHSPAHG